MQRFDCSCTKPLDGHYIHFQTGMFYQIIRWLSVRQYRLIAVVRLMLSVRRYRLIAVVRLLLSVRRYRLIAVVRLTLSVRRYRLIAGLDYC